MSTSLKSLYKKQEEIKQLKRKLAELEEEFKLSCKLCMERGCVRDSRYQLVEKVRNVRKVTDVKKFLDTAGALGWECLSVSVQKADALKIKIPEQIIEIHCLSTYQVIKE